MIDNLTSIEQKEVDFYGDELTAVRADDGRSGLLFLREHWE